MIALKKLNLLRPSRRQGAWSYGFGAAIFGWWSLDRWISTFQRGADVSSVVLTIALTSVCLLNGWWAIKALRPDPR
ncbi:hypothetical protein [Humibacillus sp. DSM 29435]|uniref:hypothetical protein n=1 Tax=Humibacillus sp. DSM 29435 TaxID=1869167 RepID=UPI0011131A96|nr:hypothetical protein [Humibacillus sp. DSM 29435]